MANKPNINSIVSEMEKGTGMTVRSIIELDSDNFVITFKTNSIPGIMYKMNKRTKEVTDFLPTMEMDKYIDACKNGVIFDRGQ